MQETIGATAAPRSERKGAGIGQGWLLLGLGLAMLFISHDLGVVHHLSDRVLVMREGVAVETGAADDVFLRPHHPYTKRLVAAVPHLHVPATGIDRPSAAG